MLNNITEEESRLVTMYRQLDGKEKRVLGRLAESLIRPRIRSIDFRLGLPRARRRRQ